MILLIIYYWILYTLLIIDNGFANYFGLLINSEISLYLWSEIRIISIQTHSYITLFILPKLIYYIVRGHYFLRSDIID